MAVVWVDAWQMECCGDPFAVGDRVVWTVDRMVGDGWFASALGPDMAARLTHVEEHHADEHEDLPEVSGRVLSIIRAWGAYGPQCPGDQVHVPLPGSARFIDVDRSDGPERHAFSDITFHGWVVELDQDM